MAAATTSPVKILSDLGYEIWEMEIPEDYRSALIEAINTLIMTNPSDGRIPILQGAIKAVQKPKFKSKKTRLNVSKVLNKTQPRLEGQKLQEDSEEVQSNNGVLSSVLVPRLDGISSALSGIGSILASQLSLERIAYERQRKRDLLNEKREREKSLENEGNTIGKTLKKIIAQPIKNFGERLLQFLKSVGLGAAVLSLYKWLQDEENLKKIKDIANWLGNNGSILIKSLLKLGRLDLTSVLGKVFKKVGSVFSDFNIRKPITALTKVIRRLLRGTSGSLEVGKATELARIKKTKASIKSVFSIARQLKPGLKITNRDLQKITSFDDVYEFLIKTKKLSAGEVTGILETAVKRGAITIVEKNRIISSFAKPTKIGFLQRLFGKKKTPQLPEFIDPKATTKVPRNEVLKLLDDLVAKGLDSLPIKQLKTFLLSPAGKALKLLDIGLDAYDTYRAAKEENYVASSLYALASISTILGRPAISLGFTGLATLFEVPAVKEFTEEGAKVGMELDPSSAFGMGGGDPFLNLLMKKREERRELEKNLNIQGDKDKIGDQSSLMPNNPNNSGGNIAMLGGNGSQSTLSAGNNPNGTEVMTNSSTNSSDNQSILTGSVYQVSVA